MSARVPNVRPKSRLNGEPGPFNPVGCCPSFDIRLAPRLHRHLQRGGNTMAKKRTPRPTTPERHRAHNTRAVCFRCCGQRVRLAEPLGASFTYCRQMRPSGLATSVIRPKTENQVLRTAVLFTQKNSAVRLARGGDFSLSGVVGKDTSLDNTRIHKGPRPQ